MSGAPGDSSARKHALLQQMGVDVWLLRTGPGDALADLSAELALPAVEPVTERAAGREPVTAAPITAAPAPAVIAQAAPQPAPSAPAGERATDQETAPAGPALAPFSVLCLSKGPALMLVEPGQSKAAGRFCLDLLAAASGLYGGESVQVTFSWPQPGVENNQRSASRALGAFVAKQLSDRAPELVLVDALSAERLEVVPEGCLLLAPLPELMVDAEKKRALWLDLEGRR